MLNVLVITDRLDFVESLFRAEYWYVNVLMTFKTPYLL